MTRAFDRRLGDDFLATVPRSPGVYRVLDAQGAVVYVGKAVNLRRRLSQYRNASRRRKHRKMREIVKSADSITFEPCASELEAELRETALIQELTPRWNVAGAFSFLYPSIGLGVAEQGHLRLAFSTAPGERADLAWHGAYRSREITGGAFFALVRLATMLGHKEKTQQRPRGTRTWCFEIADSRPTGRSPGERSCAASRALRCRRSSSRSSTSRALVATPPPCSKTSTRSSASIGMRR